MLDSSVRIHDRNKPSDNGYRKLVMPDLIKINAGFATIGQGAGPMMVTWKAGLFQKHGLDVARPPVMGDPRNLQSSRTLAPPRDTHGAQAREAVGPLNA